jgi:D-sedoheptulose 7-phosphate isomerase
MLSENEFIRGLIERYPSLESAQADIEAALCALLKAASSGKKILICGNGGSASDCSHISGELLKGFLLKRPLGEKELESFRRLGAEDLGRKLQRGIPAIPLPDLSAAFTAFCNDIDPEAAYAQLVHALGQEGDALIAISTSGNAKNVHCAALAANAKGLCVIGLTGKTGGLLASFDICIKAPETETYKIQELHLPIYHALCSALEQKLFGGE